MAITTTEATITRTEGSATKAKTATETTAATTAATATATATETTTAGTTITRAAYQKQHQL
jgi:hypothetical protein